VGKRVGDTAVAKLPRGERRMRVLEIRRAANREEKL
jgi:transcription elongation GreA/GreB family factor